MTGTLNGGIPDHASPSLHAPNSPFFVRVQVNCTYTNVFIDTGSSIAIINRHFLQRTYHNTFRP